MEPQNTKESIKELVNEFKEYMAMRIELSTLQSKKIIALLIGNISSNMLVLIFAAMGFLFGSFSLAYYLSDVFHSLSIGFLCLTGIYLFIALICFMFRKSIKRNVANNMIKQLFNSEEND